ALQSGCVDGYRPSCIAHALKLRSQRFASPIASLRPCVYCISACDLTARMFGRLRQRGAERGESCSAKGVLWKQVHVRFAKFHNTSEHFKVLKVFAIHGNPPIVS